MDVTQDDFERLPRDHAAGTSKIYSRGDLLDDDDTRRGMSPGDFLGRLVTLFGPPDPIGGYVLRHRASGLVLSAYSAQSGPAYGGAGVHDLDMAAFSAASADYQAANSALMGTKTPEETARLVRARRAAVLRMSDLRAPAGMPEIVRALEALLAKTPLTDFAIEDGHGDFGTYVVGVRNGKPFEEKVKASKK